MRRKIVSVLGAFILTCGWGTAAQAEGPRKPVPTYPAGCFKVVPNTYGMDRYEAYTVLTAAGFHVPPMLVTPPGYVVVLTIPNAGVEANVCVNTTVHVLVGDLSA